MENLKLVRDLTTELEQTRQELEAERDKQPYEPAVCILTRGGVLTLLDNFDRERQRLFFDGKTITLEWKLDTARRVKHELKLQPSPVFASLDVGNVKPEALYNRLDSLFREFIAPEALAPFKKITARTLKASEQQPAGVSRELSAHLEGAAGALPKTVKLTGVPVLHQCHYGRDDESFLTVEIDLNLRVAGDEDNPVKFINVTPDATRLDEAWRHVVNEYIEPIFVACTEQNVPVIEGALGGC